jgi:Xaa-Pro aminopeptidase
VLTPGTLPRLQGLLEEQRLDGWLLSDFKGRNPIASAALGHGIIGTRRVFAFVPRTGVPVALIHEIDTELWRSWPDAWGKHIWVRQRELEHALARYIDGLRVAADFSPRGASPYLDCVPAGTIDLLSEFARELVASAELVTRFLSIWTEEGRRSHESAAENLAGIAQYAMQRVAERVHDKNPVTEFDVSQWIRDAFAREGLVTESGPSVCVGPNAARNHYEATVENTAMIVPGQLLLVDLWAREPGGIYADQTWMASIGAPSDRDACLWAIVREARDAALNLLKDHVQKQRPIAGREVDLAAYQVIADAGFESCIAGRTGHSIDRFGLHGLGPTIDGTETDDRRALIPGIGFSVEPGIYLKGQTGVRSEVNVYLKENEILVTPSVIQQDLVIL